MRIQKLTFSGEDYQPSASPDGRFVAFASSRGGISRIWLKQMEGGGEQRLTEGPDFSPRFAPDGNSLGFLREAGAGTSDLYRTALVGGQPRRLLTDVADFDWSPDGRAVAFTRSVAIPDHANRTQLRLSIWRAATIAACSSSKAGILLGVRFRPDGKKIAVTRGAPVGAAGGWRLLLVDPATGKSEELGASEGLGSISSSVWEPGGKDSSTRLHRTTSAT